jgi:Tfp pilus assembly protein PilN
MSHEFINLLPTDRLRTFRRNYFLRLATVLLALLTILVIAHGVLLAPSYLYLTEQVRGYEKELSALDLQFASGDGKIVNNKLSMLEESIRRLAQLEKAPAVSSVISAVLGVARHGVSLSSFAVHPPEGEKEGVLTMSGVARSRDALQEYVRALSSLPFVEKVDLPISAYAKETDIDFALTLTGAFLP